MTTPIIAHPPATLEGWYVLHQIFRIDRRRLGKRGLGTMLKSAGTALNRRSAASPARTKRKAATESTAGWSCLARVIGSTSDLMLIHFRDSLDAIGEAQDLLSRSALGEILDPIYSFLSITEAGLYHITAE
ncbi:MAG: chlorite dismutase family protein, partial [Thermoanaerobaculia bacterium]